MKIARVVLNLSLDKEFDYSVPEHLEHAVYQGVQVLVPFGRSERKGHVVKLRDYSEYDADKLKSVIDICASQSAITPNLLKLGEWMSDYCCCAREQAMRTLLPRAVRSGQVKHKTLKHYSLADVAAAQSFIKKYADNGNKQMQCEALKVLLLHHELTSNALISESGCSVSTLRTLKKHELIHEEAKVVRRDPFFESEIIRTVNHSLTDEQQQALTKINCMQSDDRKQKHVLLLLGITGSGKTEVYLQAIQHCISLNKEAIVLVPEISLTPQTVTRFRARFGDRISVLHSGLSEGERFDEWSKVSEGRVKIAVGARSALFAPFKNLGLIIVDEEHEGTYKQSEAPRYHARDVAVMRGHLEEAVVVLGSATPSFESYRNAGSGKYELAELTKRIDSRQLPAVKTVDLRINTFEDGDSGELRSGFFSKDLINAVHERLRYGEQTILFLNRRGFARQMLCEQCGYVAECPDCSVSYTYHKAYETLCCHMCMSTIQAYECCPDCRSAEIRYSGLGTEKVEAVARKFFKNARIARMDSDTMRGGHKAYEAVLNDFSRGNIDILIGTQMIAKGLHVENVTLVGVLNADHGLHMPDFRAAERTFQLITQVAGRAGRGDVAGEVLIQTYSPNNEAILHAAKHDYKSFFDYDAEVRELLSYPPFGHLITVHAESEDASAALEYLQFFFEQLKPYLHSRISVAEPGPAPLERVKKKFRYMMIFRGDNMKRLRQAIRQLIIHGGKPKSVHVYADVDAVSLL